MATCSFKAIELRGKYAVGEHRFCVVDTEDFERLNRHRWKAKWNGAGNHVYAVRNAGRTTIRLHRDVMGVPPGDPRAVGHLNGNALDNRKINLRVGTQKEKLRNARIESALIACRSCGITHRLVNRLSTLSRWLNRGWTCPECKPRRKSIPQKVAKEARKCAWCGATFETTRGSARRFCCDACRGDYRNWMTGRARKRRGPYKTERQELRRRALKRLNDGA